MKNSQHSHSKSENIDGFLDPIGYDLIYIYLLSSDWFNVPKYQDYYDYMDELDCPHYFDNLPLYAIGL